MENFLNVSQATDLVNKLLVECPTSKHRRIIGKVYRDIITKFNFSENFNDSHLTPSIAYNLYLDPQSFISKRTVPLTGVNKLSEQNERLISTTVKRLQEHIKNDNYTKSALEWLLCQLNNDVDRVDVFDLNAFNENFMDEQFHNQLKKIENYLHYLSKTVKIVSGSNEFVSFTGLLNFKTYTKEEFLQKISLTEMQDPNVIKVLSNLE